jgi:hypothetical protein
MMIARAQASQEMRDVSKKFGIAHSISSIVNLVNFGLVRAQPRAMTGSLSLFTGMRPPPIHRRPLGRAVELQRRAVKYMRHL